jgi:hypothetical protein
MRKAVLVLTLLLAGCTTAGKAPEVASLRSPAATAATAGGTKAAPVIRPDSTSEEVARMRQPYMKCLKENGVPMMTTEDGLLDIDAGGNSKATNGRIMAATNPKIVAACGKLAPVLAPELDEDKNPYYADDDDNFNKCLVEHGKPLVKKDGKWVVGPGFDDWQPDEAMEIACQVKAFDGKKG